MFSRALLNACTGTALEPHCAEIARIAAMAWADSAHGSRPEWEAALQQLPALETESVVLAAGTVQARGKLPPIDPDYEALRTALQALLPWRKGPFEIHGLPIDTEWRSDWKWSRLQQQITSLEDRLVLDVGCGNGYYSYRMLGAGARAVLGIDPYLLFHYQFRALQHYLAQPTLMHLPIPFEQLPDALGVFDSVFSMGVLYHRREPLEHLQRLRACLQRGGELVLETLIVENMPSLHLEKGQRYARMRNVRCVPNPADLQQWLAASGFVSVRVLDVTVTTVAEQRTTAWMPFESLHEALDPHDTARTVEGHPAPVRAVLTARAA